MINKIMIIKNDNKNIEFIIKKVTNDKSKRNKSDNYKICFIIINRIQSLMQKVISILWMCFFWTCFLGSCLEIHESKRKKCRDTTHVLSLPEIGFSTNGTRISLQIVKLRLDHKDLIIKTYILKKRER
jgi:hypothetical protein